MYAEYYTGILCTGLAVVALVSALLVINQAAANPVNAVLWLIVAFVAVASYLIAAGMTFLGLSYVIVYVGAIAVLFLFVVMMLNLAGQELEARTSSDASSNMGPVAVLIVLIGTLVVLPLSLHVGFVVDLPSSLLESLNSLLYAAQDTPVSYDVDLGTAWFTLEPIVLVSPMNQIQALGMTLYTHGALWLMLISVLLLLAMVVPLALAFSLISGLQSPALTARRSGSLTSS